MQYKALMDPLDRLFLDRAYELAERGTGSTSPNPAVGAVVVRDGRLAGEGYHHCAGGAHAERNALDAAGDAARGATMYVSLEPCNHNGRTPPCAQAVIEAGISRVVIGALDPNPVTDGAGVRTLRDAGVEITVAHDARARAIVEPFARAMQARRPYVSLKMAVSLDGYVASKPGAQEWLTGGESREFVRELRVAHDAVAVGAGTIRIDDPHLTVRPPHHRLRDYVRVVVCETGAVDPHSRVFFPQPGYAQTVVVAPAGARERFRALEAVAHVVFVGDSDARGLDIEAALCGLRTYGIASLLCEGGPTMAGHLLGRGLVDRLYWLVAPRLLRDEAAVPAILGSAAGERMRGLLFDRVEVLGSDVLVSGRIEADV